MLLHVLPYVDRDDGEAAALELWHSAKDVARHADGSEGPRGPRDGNSENSEGWAKDGRK